LIALDSPLERETLQAFIAEPELFFSPRVVRANRCFVKGLVPKERIVRDFGQAALGLLNDLTTDPKLNPNPKPEEIVLGFKPDFEALLEQNSGALGDKKADLLRLYQQVQRSKGATEQARLQKNTFARLSFLIELLHYYEHQNTEAPDVIFAQRLPALVEQLVLGGGEALDAQLIGQAESLLTFVINPDHRLMVVNNVGKGGGAAKTLKYIMKLRAENVPDFQHAMVEFVKHLVPPAPEKPPTPQALTPIFRLLKTDTQVSAVRAIMASDRLRKTDAEALGKAVGAELGLKDLEMQLKAPELPPDVDRQMAWSRIKDLINGRHDPKTIAAAIRERLHAKYDADEIKQSWITLIEADAISLIRIFCQLPYLASGKTDPIAQTIMETYVTRLTHEKYATAYNKVLNSLKNMFKAKPDSPTLLNFLALVKWVNPEAADKLSIDIGMAAPAH
jgi:hypothetical protein